MLKKKRECWCRKTNRSESILFVQSFSFSFMIPLSISFEVGTTLSQNVHFYLKYTSCTKSFPVESLLFRFHLGVFRTKKTVQEFSSLNIDIVCEKISSFTIVATFSKRVWTNEQTLQFLYIICLLCKSEWK